jgi:hypothetical protein
VFAPSPSGRRERAGVRALSYPLSRAQHGRGSG